MSGSMVLLMRWKNLMLIGSSHIAKQSIEEIERAFEEFDPEVVCLELDPNRLQALFEKNPQRISWKDIRIVGWKGFLFARVGAWVEEKLGKGVGISPGAEMKRAAILAGRRDVPIALIDQDIAVTLRRFSKELTWQEKGRFLYDLIAGLFGKRLDFDLSKVPDDKMVDFLIDQVKGRYPSVYKVLIVERNQVMARRLAALMRTHEDKRILAIVGAGHKEGIIALLRNHFDKEPPVKAHHKV